jgi:hypothetical protein
MDLEIGSLLELQLDFIKAKPTISCIGRVVRIEDAHTNSMFRIATEFTEINDLDREIINTTVEVILKREAKKKKYPEKLLKMANPLTRRLGIAEATLGGSKIKTVTSVHLLEDELWTRKRTTPETLPLEDSKMIFGGGPTTLHNSDIDGHEIQTEKPFKPKVVDEISAKDKIQETKIARREADREAKKAKLEAERETKIAERKAEQEAKIAKREADREAKKAKLEAEREAKIAKREADREAKITDETSGITETKKKAVLGKEVYRYHDKSRETTQKKSHATSFIITYMVLMLILGFIVHRDLTKQLNSVETRLDNIVSKVVNSGF